MKIKESGQILEALIVVIALYIVLAKIFNWWPINLLNWPL